MPLAVVNTNTDPGGDWTTAAEIAACAGDVDVDVDQVASATAELMFSLSGWQFGTATDTVRPYRTGESCGCAPGEPESVGFSWTSHSAWTRAAACGCSGPSVVRLDSPVVTVDEVLVDGVALVSGVDWVVYDAQWLTRLAGRWPCCQDLTEPSTADNTFQIEYTHGEPVPQAGKIAARILGCELAKAADGQDCAFTGRVQNVVRDGVSAGIVVVDADAILRSRRTGLQVVDLWLASLPNVDGGASMTRPVAGPRGLVRPS